MAESSIEWTDKVWNPTTGCTRVSEGCRNCYAFTLHDQRHKAHKAGKQVAAQYAKPFKELQLLEHRLTDPLHWKKPCRVFVNSMSDLFHKDVPFEFIDRVFAAMACANWHTFQVLTKRPERMQEYVAGVDRRHSVWDACMPLLETISTPKAGAGLKRYVDRKEPGTPYVDPEWPLPNVWLGTSVENQAAADERIPHLLKTPAAVRFLSVEPLLEEIELRYLPCDDCGTGLGAGSSHRIITDESSPLHPKNTHEPLDQDWCPTCTDAGTSRIHGIDWVIVGGESGPGARPCRIEWIRSIVEQCEAAGVACFVKQFGSAPFSIRDKITHRGCAEKKPDGFYRYLNDKKGGDITEFPPDLRVREFPT